MTEKDSNTEERILEAAAQEFIQKGKSGARMQEIANSAGINKALLHYYYRSKDKLFESVFSVVIKKLLLAKILKIINEEEDVFQLIRRFTSTYIDVLNQNPHIPFFILEEIHKNPDRLANAFLKADLPVEKVLDVVRQAARDGKIRPIDPRQLIVNLISLCIFPLVGRNMMQPVIFQNDKNAFDQFLEARKTEVADFIIHSIQIKKD
ncbi:MAG: TetR/AcrR family transcriptional regulator [Bacteroidota bacterium]